MVTLELLRRYPFFGDLDVAQLKAIAMLAEQVTFPKGATIFEECDAANSLCLLESGCVDLYYRAVQENRQPPYRELTVGEINPGEVFGTSALVYPYELNATARTSQKSSVVKIDARGLRALMESDLVLANKLLMQIIKTVQDRLTTVRVQFAATQD